LLPKSIFLISIVVTLVAACTPSTPLSESEQAGQRIFLQICAVCHATNPGVVIVGPSLAYIANAAETRVAELNAREYLEQSILEPAAYISPGFENVMPSTFSSIYSTEELNSLIDYLMTLN
jgi:mono/diheme cytochrome c family protein